MKETSLYQTAMRRTRLKQPWSSNWKLLITSLGNLEQMHFCKSAEEESYRKKESHQKMEKRSNMVQSLLKEKFENYEYSVFFVKCFSVSIELHFVNFFLLHRCEI